MSYTIGATTGDDITQTTSGAGSNTNGQVTGFGGWFYPTTLTAARFLCSRGNSTGLSIDTTTTSLRFFSDNVTDGQWTAPANLVINKWQWFAVFQSNGNTQTPPVAVRMFAGDANTPPTELVVTTATAPTGNATGSASWTIGNRGSGAVAFQGQVAEQFVFSSTLGTLFNVATSGIITNDNAELIDRHILTPLWRCRPETLLTSPYWGRYGFELGYWAGQFDVGNVVGTYEGQVYHWIGALPGPKPVIIGGTSAFSQNHPPYRSAGTWGIPALVL